MKLFFLACLLFLFACNTVEKPPAPKTPAEQNEAFLTESASMIKSGYVVLRRGRDMTSYRIIEMSETDKTYSHAGIAVVKPEGIFVYHIVPPDLDEPKSDTLVRLEPLRKFANPDKNLEFGFGKFRISDQEVERLISHLDSMKQAGVSFDHLFDLRTQNRMYCSEMVDKALRYATRDSIRLRRNEFKNPELVKMVANFLHASEKEVQSRIYIPIENIYLDPSFEMIAQYKFSR